MGPACAPPRSGPACTYAFHSRGRGLKGPFVFQRWLFGPLRQPREIFTECLRRPDETTRQPRSYCTGELDRPAVQSTLRGDETFSGYGARRSRGSCVAPRRAISAVENEILFTEPTGLCRQRSPKHVRRIAAATYRAKLATDRKLKWGCRHRCAKILML